MTVTDLIGHRPADWWSIDDLDQLPDDGMRYELVDGCLLVSPPSTARHARVAYLLRRLLDRQAPDHVAVSNDAGVQMGSNHSYFVPDLFVIPFEAFQAHPTYLLPRDVRLVVEVLSEHNRGRDLVLKRHYYAAAGIPRYWVVDPFERTLTVLALDGSGYVEEAPVRAGTAWAADEPFPLTLDPADFC